MNYFKFLLILLFISTSCKNEQQQKEEVVSLKKVTIDFTIAFGS